MKLLNSKPTLIFSAMSVSNLSRPLGILLAALLVWGTSPTDTAIAREASKGALQNLPVAFAESYLDRVVDRVSDFTLDNGMKFIVLERHESPTVSFITYADVGGVNEPIGQTGVAHFLEHLAFKGTDRIGTRDYSAEKPLLARLDELFAKILAAKADNDMAEVERLQAEFDELQAEANQYAIQNEFGQIVEREGGVGLNATTSADATRYFYSFPANKLELWMSLESERFLNPVFREFYKEKQVILEERRLRTDNSPIGTLIEEYLDAAFQEHPYRQPTIGYPEDLANLTRQNVQDFFDKYYVPNNLTVAVVGDVDTDRVRELAEVYFGRFEAGEEPPAVNVVEPPQTEAREVEVTFPSQPWYLEGYHRPAIDHPDNAVYEIIESILSDGRTSRLYRSLVEQQQVALTAQGLNGFPGDKYPNLILFYALTAPDRSVEEVAAALHEQIELLKTEPVSEAELERVKTQARAALLRSLDSNSGMAAILAEYEVKTGDWRNAFDKLEAIEAVTAEDVMRVARETFRPENRTIGRLLPPNNEQ